MAKELARLKLRIEADTSGLKRGLNVVDEQARQTGTRMSRSFARASRAAAGMAKAVFSVRGAFVALAGVTALGLAIKRSIDFVEQIGKVADAVGISTDALQELRFAADLAGVSQEKFDKALLKLTRNIGELGRSSNELDTALRDLAPTLLADLKAADGMTEAVDLAFAALAGMEDQTRKAAVANALFGRSGILVTNIVRDGAEAFDKMRQEARDLGIIIEESLIRNAEDTKDKLTVLSTVLEAKLNVALVELAPVIDKVATALLNAAIASGRFFDSFGEPDDLARLFELRRELEGLEEERADIQDRLEGKLGPGLRDVLLGELTRLEIRITAAKLVLSGLQTAQDEAERAAAQVAPAAAAADPDIIQPVSEKEFNAAMERRAQFARLVAGALKAARTEAEVFAERLAELTAAFDAGGISQQTFNIAVEQASAEFVKASEAAEKLKLENIDVTDSFDDLATTGESAMDDLIRATEGFGREFSRTMAQAFVTGDLTFKALGQSFLVNFLEKIIQARITEPLFTFAEAFLDNLGGGASAPAAAGASTALSLSGPRFQFARGGVVESPTLVRLAHGAGLMGEAGPEAILPLTRLPGGDLGVRASGGFGKVIINNFSGGETTTREVRRGNGAIDLEVTIDRVVGRAVRSGGETFRAVRDTFGLAPATALR